MKITKQDTFWVLEDEKDDVKDFASYLTNCIPKNYAKHHLVINLLKYNQLNLDELILFLEVSNQHRSTNHSFIIVNDAISPDDLPDEMIVVPTLQEAEDVIGFEAIERELGF